MAAECLFPWPQVSGTSSPPKGTQYVQREHICQTSSALALWERRRICHECMGVGIQVALTYKEEVPYPFRRTVPPSWALSISEDPKVSPIEQGGVPQGAILFKMHTYVFF